MMEYHGIELRKYRLPIKHVVVYLGEEKPKMRTKLQKEEVFDGFTLVNAHSFSPNEWIAQEEPSKIIMAILGDYQKSNAELILKSIVFKLREVCKTNAELKKFIEQLIIISRMRNLEELTIQISKAMPITIDVEKDYLYKLGLKKAEDIIKQAKQATFKAKKRAEQLAKEKAEAIKAKAEAIKEKTEAEKAKTEAEKEKAEAIKAKVEAEKASIQKMQLRNKLSDEEIMDFLSLDEKTYKQYLKEISETSKK